MPQGVQVAHGTDGAHGVQQRALQDPQHAVIRPRPPRRLGGVLESDGQACGRIDQGRGADDGGAGGADEERCPASAFG